MGWQVDLHDYDLEAVRKVCTLAAPNSPGHSTSGVRDDIPAWTGLLRSLRTWST